MFAIIRSGGKQRKKVDLTDVLLLDDGKKRTVGAPLVKGATVKAEVLEQDRDPKVTIFKKKKRANYRRKKGHRQHKTVLRVTDIKAA